MGGEMYLKHKLGCDCKICRRSLQIDEEKYLYPKRFSFGYFLNHSCNPSCGIRGKKVVAMRDIKPGEEITVDYAITTLDKKWKMKCSCEESRCRKVIRSVQFLPKKIFEKYKNFMPLYIKRNYKEV